MITKNTIYVSLAEIKAFVEENQNVTLETMEYDQTTDSVKGVIVGE